MTSQITSNLAVVQQSSKLTTKILKLHIAVPYGIGNEPSTVDVPLKWQAMQKVGPCNVMRRIYAKLYVPKQEVRLPA